ncbi:hypothetical protein GCM10020331_055650 [Ectobacillus funiculus]
MNMITINQVSPFVNEPFTDFTIDTNKQAMQTALAAVKKRAWSTVPAIYWQ